MGMLAGRSVVTNHIRRDPVASSKKAKSTESAIYENSSPLFRSSESHKRKSLLPRGVLMFVVNARSFIVDSRPCIISYNEKRPL